MIASGTATSVRNAFLHIQGDDDVEGWGEHAPSRRVTGETLEEIRTELKGLSDAPEWVERLLEDPEHLPDNTPRPGARNALVSAWLDVEGRHRGEPAHRMLNLPEGRQASSITIPIGEAGPSVRAAQAYADEGWACFKVKLGGDHDEDVLRELRDAFPDAPIRVDANEGWSLAKAEKMLPRLRRHDVEFVEQPLARDDWDGLRKLNHEHEVPIFLDESVLGSAELLEAIRQGAADGVVIKLAKCGGVVEARRMIKIARDHGWKIMVGCMLESSVGIAAAASLVGAVDYVDLDGNALLADDPFEGPGIKDGRIATPTSPGLGVRRRDGGAKLEPIDDA